jgi:hypothetical protein
MSFFLANGATVIASKPAHRYPGNSIVLAKTSGYHPYVTWLVHDADKSAVSGHYFDNIVDAANDYASRK